MSGLSSFLIPISTAWPRILTLDPVWRAAIEAEADRLHVVFRPGKNHADITQSAVRSDWATVMNVGFPEFGVPITELSATKSPFLSGVHVDLLMAFSPFWFVPRRVSDTR